MTIVWMFLLPLVAILVPVWLGQRYGIYARKRSAELPEGPIGSAVGATLGLLAFMLAFAFQMVGNRFDKRRELLVQEVTDIRVAYLNAGLVPDPVRTNARKAIVEYVDMRVDLVRDVSKLPDIKQRSERVLDSLWSYCEMLNAQDRSSEAYSLFTSSVSQIVSLFNERITVTFQTRLSGTIFWVLGFVAFLSMLVLGFQFGISGKVSLSIILLLAVSFAAVLWLVIALDRPETGLVRLNQAPMLTLQEQLHRR